MDVCMDSIIARESGILVVQSSCREHNNALIFLKCGLELVLY